MHHGNPSGQVLAIHLEGKKVILNRRRNHGLEVLDLPSPLERDFGRPMSAEFDFMPFTVYSAGSIVGVRPSHPESKKDKCYPPFARFACKRRIIRIGMPLRPFPASEWAALGNVSGVTCPTFQESVAHLGLVTSRKDETCTEIQEAADLHRPPSNLRFQFAQMERAGATSQDLEFQF
jgi:hypothetical protein